METKIDNLTVSSLLFADGQILFAQGEDDMEYMKDLRGGDSKSTVKKQSMCV